MTFRFLRDVEGRALALERCAMAGLTLLGATFALECVHPVFSVVGLALTNVEILLLLVIGLWISAVAAARRRPSVPRAAALPAAAWLMALGTSTLLAPSHRVHAVKFFGRMTTGVLLAWATYDLLQEARRWERLVRALAVGGMLVGALGLAEALSLPFVERFLAWFKEAPTFVGERLRVSSTLGYATIASMVLELSVPLLLAWVLRAKKRVWQVLLGAGLAATLLAQVLTFTRGGVIALTAALGFIATWAVWPRSLPYARQSGRSRSVRPPLRRVWRGLRWRNAHRCRILVGSVVTGVVMLALWTVTLLSSPVAKYRLISETNEAWYRASYEVCPELTVHAEETVHVPVTVSNRGVRIWHGSGEHPFGLSYHLKRLDGTMVQFGAARITLPRQVPPGGEIRLEAAVTGPAKAGEYVIAWDMVHEGVSWFSWRGAPSEQTRLTVEAATVNGAGAHARGDSASADRATTETLVPAPSALQEQGRLRLWRAAADMVLERPLFGVGPDNFRLVYAGRSGQERADDRVHTNNLYVEWLVDTGVVGLVAFLWLTWRLVRAAYIALEGAGDGGRSTVWRAAVAGSLVAWFAHGIVDFFYEFTSTYVAFALLCGLTLRGHGSERGWDPESDHQEGALCASDST